MENKTFADFLREVYTEQGLSTWTRTMEVSKHGVAILKESAKRFANYLAAKAWEEACEAQRKEDLENVCMMKTNEITGDVLPTSFFRLDNHTIKIDKGSILLRPLAKNPYKQ